MNLEGNNQNEIYQTKSLKLRKAIKNNLVRPTRGQLEKKASKIRISQVSSFPLYLQVVSPNILPFFRS